MKKVISLILAVVMLFSVMTGLNFSSYAAQTVNTANAYNISEPKVGKTLEELGKSITVPSSAAFELYTGAEGTIKWYDLNSSKPNVSVPMDTKCVYGHRYRISVKIQPKEGYEFAEPGKFNGLINFKNADVTTYAGYNYKNVLVLFYTFAACDYQYISNVSLICGAFTKGMTLTNTFFTAAGTGVYNKTACTFTKDGNDIPLSETVNYGNFGAKVLIAPLEGYKFANNVSVKKSGTGEVFTLVSRIGDAIQVKSPDNLFTLTCSHTYGNYEYDGTTHWKSCTACGDKTNVDVHSFGAGVKDEDITTYTCTVCGYKKVDKYLSGGFRYADVSGGAQIISYNGSDVNITIPSTLGGKKVVSIADYAFANKTNIKSITIPSSVSTIGRTAFMGCSALTSINIPASVKRIEKETFLGCEKLSSVNLPYGVAFIGESAFQGCVALASIIIPCSVKTISNQAFRGCNSLESVVIPDSVTTLGNGVFLSCKGLKTAEVGSGISEIPQSLFDACSALTSVVIPTTITKVNNYAFADTALTTVYYRGTSSAEYDSINVVSASNYNKKFDLASVVAGYDDKSDIGQHKYSAFQTVAPTCVDEGYTLNVCEGCGDSFKTNIVKATGVHTFNSGAVEVAPTCTVGGVKTFACKVCGFEKTQSIPATGHSYQAVVTKPTATTLGYTTHICVAGDDEYIDSYTAPTGKQTLKCKARTAAAQTVTWNNVKTATGYQVQISTKDGKKWSTYAEPKAGTTTYTFKKLAAGNNYKFRVRFFITKEGKRYYSPWSSTLNSPTLPSATSLTKVTAGSKSFTASWKKQAVTGYQVQYSTKSNFSGAKKVTIKNAKTLKTTVKKLSAKKVYYVRVRTYKTINKVNYFSTWSKALKVKTK